MNDGSEVHGEYLVGVTEPGIFTQDGFIWVSGLRDSEWFGPTVIQVRGLPTSV